MLRWLKDLFGLPPEWGGVLTPSATFANLTGLACARHWWAARHGVHVAADGCWLHVDGAFGLFAALSPRIAHLLDGVARADSVSADGHKWLNVPFESGFAFVREPRWLGETFGSWNAPYLVSADETAVDYNCLGPESSRRARALPIWATLRAYGRAGYQAMVERHLDLTEHLGRLVEAAPDLELLAPARLCVACFRYRPQGMERNLDELNAALGKEILADGRVYVGTTSYRGMTALRPATVNWRTTKADIDLLVSVVRELGRRL